VNIVIGQRLVRKLTDKKEKYFMTATELKTLSESVDVERVLKALKEEKIVDAKATWEKVPLYRPKTGIKDDDAFSGRIGIYEVLKMSSAVKELIMQGKTDKELEAQAKKEGMLTMIEDGLFKAAQGHTTIEEILRVITE